MKRAGTRRGVAGLCTFLWLSVADAALIGEGKHKTVEAVRATKPPVIDGQLTDEMWADARPAGGFTQEFPREGAPPTERTEFRVAYDDDNLYIGVSCFDSEPDKIVARLTRRDRDIEADWVAVTVDSRHSHDSAFLFQLSAAGVQVDGQFTNDNNFNFEWDGVWNGASHIDGSGWTAEFAIPLTQLRFSADDEQTWGIQVHRGVSRKQERSQWVFVPKSSNGWVSRAGHLVGIRGLKPSRTFELRPYVVARARGRTTEGLAFLGVTSYADRDITLDAGLDVKLGLTSRLTLDATVNPDFGQVEADQVVLNLSRFETFFPEKRPFFLEGRDVFETPITLFYPRRIGRPYGGLTIGSTFRGPDGDREVLDVTGAVRILGAAKVTGNVTDEVSLAALAAVTAAENVVVADPHTQRTDVRVAPPRAYAVLRARYAVSAGAFLGLTATAATRLGDGTYQAAADHDGYTQGIDAWWQSSDGRFRLAGQLVLSERVGGATHEDADGRPCSEADGDPDCIPITRANGTTLGPGDVGFGAAGHLDYRGDKWDANMQLTVYSPKLNVNDLGFLPQFDRIGLDASVTRKERQGDDVLTRYMVQPYAFAAVAFDGSLVSSGTGLFSEWTFANFWLAQEDVQLRVPRTWDILETFDGAHSQLPPMININTVFRSNPGDTLWWQLTPQAEIDVGAPGYVFLLGAGVYWQAASNLELGLEPRLGWDLRHVRFYDCSTDSGRSCVVDDGVHHYRFAQLDATFASLTLRTTYTFSTRFSMSLYGQLFAAKGRYGSFSAVDTTGRRPYIHRDDLRPIDFNGDGDGDGVPDQDFETGQLNVNAVARWEPMPGSTIFFVYTRGMTSAFYDVRKLDRGPAEDIFLIKLVYFGG